MNAIFAFAAIFGISGLLIHFALEAIACGKVVRRWSETTWKRAPRRQGKTDSASKPSLVAKRTGEVFEAQR